MSPDKHKQREGHDGEAAKLHQRAHPNVGHAAPAEHRTVRVGLETNDRAQRREDQRQAYHDRDKPGGNIEFDDHHAVERADQQHDRHADGYLEQRQPKQPRQRQLLRGGIGERQELRPDPTPVPRELVVDPVHVRRNSKAWLL